MKYVALLSGGKDSCFNLLHCEKNGHELVAAASLRPESGKEELDSYMYQTVGQDAIEFVAQALDVPLYRRVITGSAVEQGSEYGQRQPSKGGISGDETEDLYDLLSTVKEHHPEVQGVSVGAILSNYQRVRVEHVCKRLGLTSLAYLWQRNQAELLQEMVDSGLEAVLIKVAGIGLTTAHLGKSLAQMKPLLFKLNSLYGSHICGEGGEYETLTLDCPLFKKRIKLTNTETVIHSDNDFATVAFLRVNGAELEEKQNEELSLEVPALLDETFQRIADEILEPSLSSLSISPSHANVQLASDVPIATLSLQGPWVSITNVQASGNESQTIEEEVTECFHIVSDALAQNGLKLSNCVNINILIQSMELFSRVNAVYTTFFGTCPPARACVAADIPNNKHIILDCLAFTETKPNDRQALHVQGLSYWAPANIGPYSQAISANDSVFVSGQIGLIPATLGLPNPRSLPIELALSCQHAYRIAAAVKETAGNNGMGDTAHTESTIYWLCDVKDLNGVKSCLRSLQVPEHPILFAMVRELPKGALVEKQVMMHTGRCKVIDEDGEEEWDFQKPLFNQGKNNSDPTAAVSWQGSRFEGNSSSFLFIFVKGDPALIAQKVEQETAGLKSYLSTPVSVKYFYKSHSTQLVDATLNTLFGKNVPPILPICCSVIANVNDDDWDAAFGILSR